jgi:hypothetical protein
MHATARQHQADGGTAGSMMAVMMMMMMLMMIVTMIMQWFSKLHELTAAVHPRWRAVAAA